MYNLTAYLGLRFAPPQAIMCRAFGPWLFPEIKMCDFLAKLSE